MLHVVTPPAKLPLDWETEVKGHLRLDNDEEQVRIEAILVAAADQKARTETNLSLVTRELRLTLDAFPLDGQRLELPRAPLRTIVHVKYKDTDGVQQTWPTTEYDVFGKVADYPPPDDGPPAPGQIYPKYDKSWPSTRCEPNAVEIQFTAGYGDTYAKVPALLRAGMLLLVGEMFERREDSIVGTIMTPASIRASDIFRQFRVPKFREGWAA